MKIRPVILCGGAGTRLWPNKTKHQAKQFIDFGGWTLLGKTLERIKGSMFDYPIISTNLNYLNDVKKQLKRFKFKKYKIVLEPAKKNTGPAILSSALIKDIPDKQPLIFLSSDQLIENVSKFNNELKKNSKFLNDKNIFIFGIKPDKPSDQYGYFTTKRTQKLNKVLKFIEKPKISKAKIIIKKGGYWNSGMFFLRKDSLINNFMIHQKKMFRISSLAVSKGKLKNNIFYINKKIFYKKKNTFYRPWGSYTNLFNGNNFLIKELSVNPKGILSLQKHFHRSEHWVITQGIPKITLYKKLFLKKPNETIFIPKRAIHRIQNPSKKIVKIMEAQLGLVLKESDIVRYEDIYGRAN